MFVFLKKLELEHLPEGATGGESSSFLDYLLFSFLQKIYAWFRSLHWILNLYL